MPPTRIKGRPPKPGDLLGVVVSWPPPTVSPQAGNRSGGGAGRVRLEGGSVVDARWSGAASANIFVRPDAEGQRVRLSRDTQGVYRATLVERGEVATKNPTAPPRRKPLAPLPETLRRAVAAGLAAGESPWTIAARHGIAVEQLRRKH
jgi:hypothetical protein